MNKIDIKVTEKAAKDLSEIIPAGYGYICIILKDSNRDVITNLTPRSLHDVLSRTLDTAPAMEAPLPSLN